MIGHDDSFVEHEWFRVQVHEDDDNMEVSIGASTDYPAFVSKGFCFVANSLDSFDPIESSDSALDCDSSSSRSLGGADVVKKWESELLASRENEGRQASPPITDASAPDVEPQLSIQPLSGIDLVKKWEAELLACQENQGGRFGHQSLARSMLMPWIPTQTPQRSNCLCGKTNTIQSLQEICDSETVQSF
jgi:hypothetical protein